MSTLLYSLGRWAYRRPWRVIVSWVLLLGLAGGGMALFAQGTDNTFSIPGTESQAGLAQLNRSFPSASGTSAQIIVVAADGDNIGTSSYTEPIADTLDQLGDLDGVLAVTDPFDDAVSGLVSDADSAALIRMQFDGQSTDIPPGVKDALGTIADDLQDTLPAGSEVALGGDLFATSVPGVTLTEAVGLLIALFVLIVTFRSFRVAGLPIVSAIIGVGLAITLIFLSTAFASISSTTPLLALMLGLAVGIDYALFIIARHQDQVRAGADPEESAARASGTAGSAVVFAGVTVLIALVGLAFAQIPFLTTMGIAAAVAVAIAVAVALTITPAFLGLVKGRVVGWRSPRTVPSTPDVSRARSTHARSTQGRGFAERWVGLVTRHPIITTVSVVLALGVIAIPAASLALALPNAGMLPKESEARQSYDLVAENFGPGFNGPLILTGTIVESTAPVTLLEDLGDDIATIPGVKEIALVSPNRSADTGIVQVIPETAPDDPATAELVRTLRAEHDRILDEYNIDVKVTGFTAVGIDISDRLGAALLPFGIFVVGLSLILLTLVFRSIWVPIKAALGYLLSVTAAFGVVSAVFEWGWFAEALHVTRTGPVISFMPIVVMGVLFGLAMDYQVFLVSRMREDYVHSARGIYSARDRAVAAVRTGFTSSARVVIAAAVIMFAVFAAFVPEGDATLKPIALGLATGILIDAFVVRMTLVPAVMALLGEKAWWMPRWLDRLLPKVDIEGESVQREVDLASWPEPGSTSVIAADDLSVRAKSGALFEGVRLRVEPGEAVVVVGDRLAVRALLLTLAARMTPSTGRLRVAGHLLPGRAAWVRATVGVALIDETPDPVREVRRTLRARIAVLDAVDRLGAEGSVRGQATVDQAAAALRDVPAGHTVILGSTDADAALALLQASGRRPTQIVELTGVRPVEVTR